MRFFRAAGLIALLAQIACGSSGPTPARVIGGEKVTGVPFTPKDYQQLWSLSQSGGQVTRYVAAYDFQNNLTCSLDCFDMSRPATSATRSITTTAQPTSVVVSNGSPDAVAWVDKPDPSTLAGIVTYVDLTSGALTPVNPPGLDGGTPADGVYFGATGDELLYYSNFDTTTQTAALSWWNGGANSNATPITGKSSVSTAPPYALRMSADGTHAIAAVDYDYTRSAATATLVYIDMASGQATVIDTDVVIYAAAWSALYEYAFPTNGDNDVFSQAAQELPAFSVTPDLSAAVYTKLAGGTPPEFNVFVWQASGAVTQIQSAGMKATGIFPGISSPGNLVAWWDFSNAAPGPDAQLLFHVWSVKSMSDVFVANFNTPTHQPDGRPTISMPAMPPLFSPDEGLVLFLSDFEESGAANFQPPTGASGQLWMLPAANIPQASSGEETDVALYATQADLGTGVSYDSIVFGPQEPGKLSTLLFFLGDCTDALGNPSVASNAACDLYTVDTAAWPPPAMEFGKGNQQDSSIAPGNTFYLPATNCVAYVKGIGGHPFVWCDDMPQPRDLEATTEDFVMAPKTFQTFQLTKELGYFPSDGILYVDEAHQPPVLFDPNNPNPVPEGQIHVVQLITGNEPVSTMDTGNNSPAEDNAFLFAAFETSGRVMGCYDRAADEANADAGTTMTDGGTSSSVCYDMPLP